VSNTYQTKARPAQPDPLPGEVAVPEQVIVSMAEIAESAKEGLLALAVGTGLQVMAAMFGEDAERLCGPEGKHNPGRAGYRHGSEAGSVTLGGRRVPVSRPRVRAADGSGELHLPSYDLFSSTEILGRLAMEKMLAGLSSRRYVRGLEPVPSTPEGMARFVLAGPGLTDRTVTLPFLSADDDGRRGWWAGLPGGAACWLVGLTGPLPWLPVSLGRCRGSGPVPRDGVR